MFVGTKRGVAFSSAFYESAIDLGDSVVEDSLELVTRNGFCDVNVPEIAVETIVSKSDLSWTNWHEPHLKILKTLHLGEVIIPYIIDPSSFLWICYITTIALAARFITMTGSITNNDHHVIVVLVLTLCHVGQSTLHSILHVFTPSTTANITITTTSSTKPFQSSSQLREITRDATVVIRLRPLIIVLVLNDLTHN